MYDKKLTNMDPNFCNYQLLGDSQLLRFSEQFIKKKKKQIKTYGLTYVGFLY